MSKDSLVKFGLDGVMGYHRPVSEFNRGKKSEYYSRLCFKEEKAVKRMQSDTKSAQNEKPAA